MSNKKVTKRALLTSILAICMCLVMLVGSTFAWFTDTASAGVNKIQSGTLDVALEMENGTNADGTIKWDNAEGKVLNFLRASGVEGVAPAPAEDILWEPGCTYVLPKLRVVNNGNLALKYKIMISGIVGDNDLKDAIIWTIDFGNDEYELDAEHGLAVAASNEFTIKGQMKEEAGNEYMNKTITGVGITVLATQDTVEYDSINNQYDADATYGTTTVSNEKELRTALYNAPADGTNVKITLTGDITLETLYAAENFGTDTLADNAEGDTLNRYKIGVHPSADDPSHWNKLVTDQTQEERIVYGAYYHMGANDERVARLVVKSGQNVTIDLNGHTIEKAARATHGDWSNVCTDIIGNYGTLTLVDSIGTGVVKGHGYNSCGGAVLHNYGGTMIVKGVNVDGNAAGMTAGTGQYVIVNDDGTTVIDGANVYDTLTTVDASLLVNTAGAMTIKGNSTLNHPNTKNINVKGGEVFVESATIISNNYAIYAKGGKVEVIDADVTVTGTGTMTEDGGTITHK